MSLVITYAAVVLVVLALWVLSNPGRRHTMREDLRDLFLALYSGLLWIRWYPGVLWRLRHYKPRHALYRPELRAWTVRL